MSDPISEYPSRLTVHGPYNIAVNQSYTPPGGTQLHLFWS